MNNKVACVSLNFDSIGHAIGKSPMEDDPTFSIVFNRIREILDKYNIKISIFVIGKDLEDHKNSSAVKSWHNDGHEIGNHSYTHPLNFSSLSKEEIYEEIKKTDDIIFKTIGKKPVGFIAPGWNSSKKVLHSLVKLNYKYDHSLFSSPILLLGLFKLFYNYLKIRIVEKSPPKTYKLRQIFNRRDFIHMFFGRTKPFQSKKSYTISNNESDSIKIFPIPSSYRLSYWLTLEYVFPKKITEFIFNLNTSRKNFFYILMHPADFITEEDLKNIDGTQSFERINTSLDKKLQVFENRIKQLLEMGYTFKTFDQLI